MNSSTINAINNIANRARGYVEAFSRLADRLEGAWTNAHPLALRYATRTPSTVAMHWCGHDLMVTFRTVVSSDATAFGELSVSRLIKISSVENEEELLLCRYFDNLNNVRETIDARSAHTNLADERFVEVFSYEIMQALLKSAAVSARTT